MPGYVAYKSKKIIKKKRSKLKGTIHIKKHAVCKIMTTGRVKTIQTNGTRVPSPFELCNVS